MYIEQCMFSDKKCGCYPQSTVQINSRKVYLQETERKTKPESLTSQIHKPINSVLLTLTPWDDIIVEVPQAIFHKGKNMNVMFFVKHKQIKKIINNGLILALISAWACDESFENNHRICRRRLHFTKLGVRPH